MNVTTKIKNGYHKRAEAEITLKSFKTEADMLVNADHEPLPNCFPIHVFPEAVREFINELVMAYKLPPEYYGATILTACAGIIGNSIKLRYKNGYIVPATLYTAIIGYSSSGKTPAMDACLAPLYDIEAKMDKEHLHQTTEWESECATLAKGQPIPPKPIRRELMINNATIEAINGILKHNPNGLIMVMDELLGWTNGMNQYRKGADEQFWLSNWSNSPIKVNRASKDTIFIPRPNISVIGGLQPGVLKQLATGDKRDNGFIYRLLFAYPKYLDRPVDADQEPNESVIAAYNTFIQELFNLVEFVIAGLDEKTPTFFAVLSDSARSIYNAWKRKIIGKSNESGCDSTIAAYGKMEQYCLRFALILAVLEQTENPKNDFDKPLPIEKCAIENAIELTEYFIKNMFRVLNIIDEVDPLSELNQTKRATYTALSDTFETAQGLAIAKKKGMKERTFHRFIKDKTLFINQTRGRYAKKI